MIPVAPVALPLPENVSVVGESFIPLVDSDRIPTAVTLNSSDSVPCNIMPLVWMCAYPNDEAKRNSCRLSRNRFPVSFCEHLNLMFPDVKNATDKSFSVYFGNGICVQPVGCDFRSKTIKNGTKIIRSVLN